MKTVRQIMTTKEIGEAVKDLVFYTLIQKFENAQSNEEIFRATSAALLEIKLALQNEIADGFSEGFSNFTGHTIDFYCDIAPEPKALNKEIC